MNKIQSILESLGLSRLWSWLEARLKIKEKKLDIKEGPKQQQADNKEWNKSLYIPSEKVEAAVKALWLENKLKGLKHKRERNRFINLLKKEIRAGHTVRIEGWVEKDGFDAVEYFIDDKPMWF